MDLNSVYNFLTSDIKEVNCVNELRKLSFKLKNLDASVLTKFVHSQNIPTSDLKVRISKITQAKIESGIFSGETIKFIDTLLSCLLEIEASSKVESPTFKSVEDARQFIMSTAFQAQPIDFTTFVRNIFKENNEGVSLFSALMKSEGSNEIFDQLIKLIHDREIELNNTEQKILQNYAFSVERYNSLFLNKEQVNGVLLSTLESCKKDCHHSGWKLTQEDKYLQKHAAASNTVKEESAFRDWKETYTYIQDLAESKTPLSWSDVVQVNKMLTRSKPTASNVTDLVYTSGDINKRMFCPTSFLDSNLMEFDRWFKQGQIDCDSGDLNPILFASQAYQRIVSLHPFHDGNGRTGRLILDFILLKYNIIPPNITETDVSAGVVFPFDFSDRNTGEDFLRMIVTKIYETAEEFYVYTERDSKFDFWL